MTFRFAEQQMNDTAFNSAENLQIFRMISADVAEAGTVVVERLLSNIPRLQGDDGREEINFFTDNTMLLLDTLASSSEAVSELFQALGENAGPVMELFKAMGSASTPPTISPAAADSEAAPFRVRGAGEQIPLGE